MFPGLKVLTKVPVGSRLSKKTNEYPIHDRRIYTLIIRQNNYYIAIIFRQTKVRWEHVSVGYIPMNFCCVNRFTVLNSKHYSPIDSINGTGAKIPVEFQTPSGPSGKDFKIHHSHDKEHGQMP